MNHSLNQRNEDLAYTDYVSLNLPEFSPSEETLRALKLNFQEFQKYISIQEESGEKLMEQQGSTALRTIDSYLADYTDQLLESLDLPENLTSHAKNAVRRKDWSGVETDSGEHFTLRELIAKSNQLKFSLIKLWIENAENTGLTTVAEQEYLHLMPIMISTDTLYIKMVTEKFPINSQLRGELGMTDECAVVRLISGAVVEIPFHEAYQTETQAIVKGYKSLLKALDKITIPELNDLIQRKKSYYNAVLKAFQTSNVEDWGVADSLLPRQIRDGNDAIHVHPIEVGYMKDRILRSPEVSLRIPDDAEKRAQELTLETKKNMLKSLQNERFQHLPAIASSINLLENSNAQLRHFLGSGMEMDLKPAGQILPNTLESRNKGGIDSSLDMDSARERYPLAKASAEAVFGKSYYEQVFTPVVDHEKEMGGDIASHELGHAVGLVKGGAERMGGVAFVGPYIEEWKATVAGLMGDVWIPYLEGERSIEDLKGWIINHTRTACRYASVRNKASIAAYFRKSMMIMKVAEESGIIYKKQDQENSANPFPWALNLENEKTIHRFFEKIFDQFKTFIDIYGQGTESDLVNALRKNLQPTEFIQFICERTDDGTVTLPSAKKLCKLPQDAKEEYEARLAISASTRQQSTEVLSSDKK